MKKKGFTLIELLGVIIILAVIALIAVPTILGIIDKAKRSSLQDSGYGLVEAANLYYAQYSNSKTVRFDIEDNKIITEEENKLNCKGTIKNGTVLINNKGEVTVCINDGKHAAYKNYQDNKVTVVDKKTCTVPESSYIVYLDDEATITEMTNQELTVAINNLTERVIELENKNEELILENINLKKQIGDLEEGVSISDYINDLKNNLNTKVDKTQLETKLDVNVYNSNNTWKKITLSTPLIVPESEWITSVIIEESIVGAKEIILENQNGFQIHLYNIKNVSKTYVTNGIPDAYNLSIHFYANFSSGQIYITTARIGTGVISEQLSERTFDTLYYR